MQDKETEKLSKIDLILDLAREVGVTEDNGKQWVGVLLIAQSEATMRVFLKSAPKRKDGHH